MPNGFELIADYWKEIQLFIGVKLYKAFNGCINHV